MDNNEVLGLLPKSRKNLLRIIFSRLGLVVITIIAELVLLVGAYLWAFSYFKWLVLVQFVFTIIMILYLFNCSMDASAKLTWLFLIMLAPVPASIFLWFTQKNFGHRMVKERTAELIEATKDMLKQDKETLYAPELIESGTDDLCRYVNRSGCFPIYKNTSTTFFPSGEAKFEAMLEELKKAEKFIFLEYFIITEGFMWGSILKILADKAAQGVDVRVMYDGMCEISTLTADYPKRLAKLGIKCKPFSAIHPFLSSHYNYRDHRKILVIDGKVEGYRRHGKG